MLGSSQNKDQMMLNKNDREQQQQRVSVAEASQGDRMMAVKVQGGFNSTWDRNMLGKHIGGGLLNTQASTIDQHPSR
jgi:hypothetical protein